MRDEKVHDIDLQGSTLLYVHPLPRLSVSPEIAEAYGLDPEADADARVQVSLLDMEKPYERPQLHQNLQVYVDRGRGHVFKLAFPLGIFLFSVPFTPETRTTCALFEFDDEVRMKCMSSPRKAFIVAVVRAQERARARFARAVTAPVPVPAPAPASS